MFARRRLAGRLIPVNTHFITARGLQASSRSRFPAKDSQDKDSLKPEPNEYSKSASDDKAAAATEEAAFSPNMTRPEEEHDHAGKEASGQDMNNPLNVSPANQNVSQPRDPQEGGAQGSPGGERGRMSGGGSPPKGGGGKSG